MFSVKAQEITVQYDTPTAIAKYYFVSENQIHLSMGIEDETNRAIMFQRDDAKAREFMTTSLNQVVEALKKEVNMAILPIETLEGKVVYSKMGFPLSSLKKAAKSGDQQQYITIEIAALASKTITSENSQSLAQSSSTNGSSQVELSATASSTEFYPQVQVKLKFGDASGKTIAKYKGVYTHPERVAINTLSTDVSVSGQSGETGVSVTQEEQADQIAYFEFLEKATADLIRQLKE